jgi:predicted acetyltransferase
MVALVQVDAADMRLGRLLQLYIHEWSGMIPISIRADALYTYDELVDYCDRNARAAFLFMDSDNATPVGFAMAMRDPSDCWHVEEFFVLAGARRRGVGRIAAEALFAARPGRWTLTVRPENPGALRFWRAVSRGADESVEVGEDGVSRTRLSFAV